jgi:hypothetical protein
MMGWTPLQQEHHHLDKYSRHNHKGGEKEGWDDQNDVGEEAVAWVRLGKAVIVWARLMRVRED